MSRPTTMRWPSAPTMCVTTRGGAMVSGIPRLLPRGARCGDVESSVSPTRCSRRSSTPRRRRNTSTRRTTIRAIRKSESAGYAALTAYQKAAIGAEWQRAGRPAAARNRFRRQVRAGVPDHPDSAGVLTRADEAVFAAGDLPRAIADRRHTPGAQSARRCGEAAHRLDHHRRVELQPEQVRRGGAGFHPGARARCLRPEDER